MYKVRPFRSQDLPQLYKICIATGAAGDDASNIYKDPNILGHFYVGPYATLEPELCFVLENKQSVRGYVVGVKDSVIFSDRCERSWFPQLRKKYPLPDANDRSADARMIQAIHRGHDPLPSNDFPAHLHIDLLEDARGQGFGRQLMQTLFCALRQYGVEGVQLTVGSANIAAIGFYQRLKFVSANENQKRIIFTKRLECSNNRKQR